MAWLISLSVATGCNSKEENNSWMHGHDMGYNGSIICEMDNNSQVTVDLLKDNKATSVAKDINFTPETPNKDLKFRLTNKLENNNLSIYFVTNESRLEHNDIQDILVFWREIRAKFWNDANLILEWYTDFRWNNNWNYVLSMKRVQAIKDVLLNNGFNFTFSTVAHWESNSITQPARTRAEKLKLRPDRRVTIKPEKNIIVESLKSLPADIYLLDASWSMLDNITSNWNTTKWDTVSNFTYPKGSKIYTFTTDNSFKECAQDLESQIVDWSTPLLLSLNELVKNNQNSNKVVTLLTDWEDTEWWVNINKIIQNARQLNIKINIVSIGWNNLALKDISLSTWWSYYIKR